MIKLVLHTVILALTITQGYSQSFDYLPTSTTNQVIKHTYFALSYSGAHKQAEWVAYELTKEEVYGTVSRTDDFRPDPLVKMGSAQLSDYKYSGYDRGHLAPAGDMKMSHTSMSESFFLSNMSPQTASFNRGIWVQLEKQVRTWAVENGGIYVVTGGIFKSLIGHIGTNQVSIPGSYYKVILDYREPGIKAIALVLPNSKGTKQLAEYVVTIDYVEMVTGIDFFPALPDSIEDELENSKDASNWSFKPITISSSGSNSTASQCKGIAKSTGVQCRKTTKDASGYCHYHTNQSPGSGTVHPAKSTSSARCSGTTKAGNRCKRMTTSSSGRCYQH